MSVAMPVPASPLQCTASAVCSTGTREPGTDIRSHYVYDGSEAWCHVPEPRVPCDNDPSGLGVPGPTAIAGYVYWTRGERGPKTKLQAYADAVSALMLAVHPLEPADCKPPSAAEVDRMRVRNALQPAAHLSHVCTLLGCELHLYDIYGPTCCMEGAQIANDACRSIRHCREPARQELPLQSRFRLPQSLGWA